MGGIRILHRRRGRLAGLMGLTVAAAAGMVGSAAMAPASWAASSAGALGGAVKSATTGEASKPALTILADAKRATKAASTAHVVGSLREGGSTISFNLVVGHGQGGGTLDNAGETFDIVVHKKKVYLEAPKATWTKLANSAAAEVLANRWLYTTTANQDFADFANLLEIVQLTNQFTPSGTLFKKGTTTFDGQPAIPLFDSGVGGGTLYVAARGTPYILGLTGTKANPGRLLFSEYNTAKVPPAPKNAINFDELESGGNSGGSSSTTTAGGSGAGTTSSTLPGGL
jgi:hypothetical protein